VSDEEQKDAFAQREEGDDDAADVEAHAHGPKDAHRDKDATEEPPDVEGHSFDAPAAHSSLDQND
jgi:hypothetical protein